MTIAPHFLAKIREITRGDGLVGLEYGEFAFCVFGRGGHVGLSAWRDTARSVAGALAIAFGEAGGWSFEDSLLAHAAGGPLVFPFEPVVIPPEAAETRFPGWQRKA